MAPPIVLNDERGSALIESIPVIMALLALVSGLLMTSYLLFARAWIQWQSEQALYCLAVGSSQSSCKRTLSNSLEDFLNIGDARVQVSSTGERWTVEVDWHCGDFRYRVAKTLAQRQLTAKRDLRW